MPGICDGLGNIFINGPYAKMGFMIWTNCTLSQSAFTCSKLTIETLEEGVKYVQS